MTDVFVKHRPFVDPRLGYHTIHDPRSLTAFRATDHGLSVDPSTWVNHKTRIYDPYPRPNQSVGNCTMCATAMQLNARGNRVQGVVLDMDWAMMAYENETANDEFPGAFPPEDTGSSSLASAKTAQRLGVGGAYYWFTSWQQVVQATMPSAEHPHGRAVKVGTRWDQNMFDLPANRVLSLGGGDAGGHEWIVRGADLDLEAAECLTWWGSDFYSFKVRFVDLDELLSDDGDAHWQERAA